MPARAKGTDTLGKGMAKSSYMLNRNQVVTCGDQLAVRQYGGTMDKLLEAKYKASHH